VFFKIPARQGGGGCIGTQKAKEGARANEQQGPRRSNHVEELKDRRRTGLAGSCGIAPDWPPQFRSRRMASQIPADQVRSLLDTLVKHVHSRLGGRIREFSLRMHNGGVVLTGCTHTYSAGQLAQECVMEMTDLPILANDIEVN